MAPVQPQGLYADLSAATGPGRSLCAADELLHPAPAGVWQWTETSWWPTVVPEHHLLCWVYCLFRPNVGTVDAGVWIIDDRSTLPWEMPYARFRWGLPIPDGSLTDLTIGDTLRLRCTEPFQSYALDYADGDLIRLHLDFAAVHPPHAQGLGEVTGRYDQPLSATGELEVDGRKLTLRGVTLHDRAWSPRPDTVGRKAHFTFGVSPSVTFTAMSVFDPDGRTKALESGQLHLDGQAADLVRVERRVLSRAPGGRPLRLELVLEDGLGRTVLAKGDAVSAGALWTQPSLFSWISMVRWTIDGHEVWGEDDEAWTPEALASVRRSGHGADVFEMANGHLPPLSGA
jgi:hypothetical protein